MRPWVARLVVVAVLTPVAVVLFGGIAYGLAWVAAVERIRECDYGSRLWHEYLVVPRSECTPARKSH